jgi:hypothetical protein
MCRGRVLGGIFVEPDVIGVATGVKDVHLQSFFSSRVLIHNGAMRSFIDVQRVDCPRRSLLSSEKTGHLYTARDLRRLSVLCRDECGVPALFEGSLRRD